MTKNNTVIITGAGQRIGFSLTQYFLAHNYHVIAITRNSHDSLIELKKEFNENLTILHKDFNHEKIQKDFWILLENKTLQGFIHCASTFYEDTILNVNQNIANIQKTINCDTFIDACTSFLQSGLSYKKAPAFIAFLDSKLENLNPSHYSYTLSKLQLKSCIQFLAMTSAPKIRVNAISPGLTLPSGNQTVKDFNNAQNSLPFGFGVNLTNIQQTIDFIINNDCLVGQNIVVDAGQHLQSLDDIILRT